MSALAVGLIFLAGMVAFATGRVRHDLVAVAMLLAGVVFGAVPAARAFEGFADPVVVTVAAVMAISAAIARSGALRLALAPFRSVLVTELGIAAIFSILCAVASGFMNNVGALALLLPAALGVCRSAGVSPSRVLMPMAFASLLGGLLTLIGTPPNVIIAGIRANYAGVPFGMFDFTIVGAGLAVAGVALLLMMIRILPARAPATGDPLLFQVADYLFEVRVGERDRAKLLTVGEVCGVATGADALVVHAIDREGIVIASPDPRMHLRPGDIVQLEGRAPIVQGAIGKFGFEVVGGVEDDRLEAALFECVVTDRSSLASASGVRQTLAQSGVALLAVSRRGRAVVEELARFRVMAGDIVLLQAPVSLRADLIDRFALLPLAERPIEVGFRKVEWRPVLVLTGAIISASLGAPLAIALLAALAILAVSGGAGQRFYRDIDWSIIVLLAAIIPVAQAFSDLGAGQFLADGLAALGSSAPDYIVIGAALLASMLVTPFLNNAAAVILMAPIAARVGQDVGVNVDAMLMAVAVGASCDFLTPIGHQSNTLVMGPGGYRFLDYPRLGAPLSLLVLVLGTVLIKLVWAS